jgi:hypothetical protein
VRRACCESSVVASNAVCERESPLLHGCWTLRLRLDQILNGIPIVVTSVEVLMSIVALCRFHRYNQL